MLDAFNEISSATRYFENRSQDGRVQHVTDYLAEPDPDSEHGQFGYADTDLCPRTVHRADLHRLLVQEVGCEHVRIAHRLASVVEHEDHVALTFTDGVTVRAGLLIAADGLRSTVRTLFDDSDIHYCGAVIFRAVSPAGCLDGLGPNDRLRSWRSADHGKHVIAMPVRAGAQVSVDATLAVDEPPRQLWSAQADLEALARQFDGFDQVVPRMIRAATGPVFMHPVYDRDPIPRWTTARIALLGDAAHPMTPFGGQGANQAIQDAAELAAQIAIIHDDAYSAALARYQRVRVAQTAAIQRSARRFGEGRATVPVRLAEILLR